MNVLNQDYVGKDEYRRIAGGANPPRIEELKDGSGNAEWTSWSLGQGGMIAPRQDCIPARTTLVRFSSFRDGVPKDKASGPQYFGRDAASGAWWLDWVAYKAIEHYADRIGESVAYAVRQVCAVPIEWSDMSYVVQGTTRSPLMVYAGMGKPVKAAQGVIDPLARGKPRIEQYYIPGLSDPDLNKKAIIVHSHAPLDPTMAEKGAKKRTEIATAMRARIGGGVR